MIAKISRLLLLLALLPGAAAAAEPAPVPFPFDWSRVGESRIDLSRFLDAPAGKAGPLRVEGGHFVTGEGQRVRFWGVNLAVDICFADKAQAPRIAEDLARWGVNLVRFHHVDTDWGKSLIDLSRDDTQHLGTADLDRFDFLVAELKKRGIWTLLTLNIHRKYKANDGVRDWEILGIGKAATYFNPRLIELQHASARALLTHQNPYTGLTYAQDPAVAGIELLNENSLLEAWAGFRLRHGVKEKTDDTWQPIPDSYATELDALYFDWLVKSATPEQRAAVAQETGVSFTPRPEKLPEWLRLTPNLFSKASAARFQAEADFLMQVEAEFFDDYRRLIRDELGSKALLTLSNDHNDGISGYPHLRGNLRGDWIDGHGYWEHPTIGAATRSKNTPMVNDPLDSTVTQSARSPVAGRPFTIGEVNHPFPHRFAAEGYPILAAYAQFHDWDGIAWFDWEKGRLQDSGAGVQKNGWFDVSNDPVKLAQLATCALMWHRHDVAPAKATHLRVIGESATVESLRLFQERPFFQPGFDLTTPLRHATRFTFDTKAQASPPGAEGTPRRPWDPAPEEILSDTGELRWSHADRRQGLVAIDTARTCGLIGFIRTHWWKPAAATRHLAAEPENDHCSILLTSLDDRPIASSARLLLTATSRSANTSQTWRDDFQTLAEWGRGPMTIVPVAGTVTLKNLGPVKAVRATPLSPEGRPAGEPRNADAAGADWKIKLGTPPTTWWEIELQR